MPETIGVDELRSLETSVLKALCLTINTAGSELKYKILDSLSEDDFYFPILRAVFRTLGDMHARGDYVISSNLEEELQKIDGGMPAGFAIDPFFEGNLPSLSEITGWIHRLKERSRSGLVPTVSSPLREAPKTPPPRAETIVKPVAEIRKKIAEELRKSNPAQAPAPVAAPISPPPRPAAERSSPSVAAPPPKPKAPPTPPPREVSPPPMSLSPPPRAKPKPVLASEGDDWSSYLSELEKNQGKTFETGFQKLDREIDGLGPGLLLLVDEDRQRLLDFLKQVTDQMAASGQVRSLFVASELSKSALRLRTLARLASVPAPDIERGRLRKDSAEWQRVDRAGRAAAEWLRRVFVYESDGDLDAAVVRDLTAKLQESADKESCVVVVDSLEKFERKSGNVASGGLARLKALADSLGVLVFAASTDPTLLASRDADYASVFRTLPSGEVELELLRAGRESSTIARFRYEPDYCRFIE
jgi:hypothetical protein